MAAVCENPDKIVTDEPFFSRHSETIAPQIVCDYSRLLEIVNFIGIYRFGFFWVRIWVRGKRKGEKISSDHLYREYDRV